MPAGAGGWSRFGWNDETGDEVEFDMATHIMAFVKEGDVVIVMESGAEKLRYVTGWAKAYVRQGDAVRECGVDLDEIYGKAAIEFGIAVEEIIQAIY